MTQKNCLITTKSQLINFSAKIHMIVEFLIEGFNPIHIIALEPNLLEIDDQ